MNVERAIASIKVQKRTLPLLKCAVQSLADEHPMTLRQLFYRMVSQGVLPSTEDRYYRKLGALMTRLREAGGVPRTWLVDHIRATLKPSSWSGLADFGETIRRVYRKDFWSGMPHHVEVFCEKDAIAGTLQPVTNEFDVALRVCRGYSSVSFAGEIADLWTDIEKPIFAYYLGDFDPSGFDIERDLTEKLGRYSGRSFEWKRLAVNEDDFDAFGLLPLAVKVSDRRSSGFVRKYGTRCAEVDALPPDELRERVRNAIEGHIEQEEWQRLKRIENLEKKSVGEYMATWSA